MANATASKVRAKSGLNGRQSTPRPREEQVEIRDIEDIDLSDPKHSGFVRVSPEGAAKVLEKNLNRTHGPAWVKFLADQMSSGKWCSEMPDGVVGDVSGRLRNGQHRLRAVILSGKTIVMRAYCGLGEEAIKSIDTNKVRNLRDRFFFDGKQALSKVSAAMVRLGICKDHGWQARRLTVDEGAEYYARRKSSFDFVDETFGPHGAGFRMPTLLAVAELHEISPEWAKFVSDGLLDRTLKATPQPIVKLKIYLASVQGKGGAAMDREVYEKCVGAFKAVVEGRDLVRSRRANWSGKQGVGSMGAVSAAGSLFDA